MCVVFYLAWTENVLYVLQRGGVRSSPGRGSTQIRAGTHSSSWNLDIWELGRAAPLASWVYDWSTCIPPYKVIERFLDLLNHRSRDLDRRERYQPFGFMTGQLVSPHIISC